MMLVIALAAVSAWGVKIWRLWREYEGRSHHYKFLER
jgi:hypothetical protein